MIIYADRNLYLTGEPSKRIVEEGDADASYLLCGRGNGLDETVCATFGIELVDGKVVYPDMKPDPVGPKPVPESEASIAPQETKPIHPTETKRGGLRVKAS